MRAASTQTPRVVGPVGAAVGAAEDLEQRHERRVVGRVHAQLYVAAAAALPETDRACCRANAYVQRVRFPRRGGAAGCRQGPTARRASARHNALGIETARPRTKRGGALARPRRTHARTRTGLIAATISRSIGPIDNRSTCSPRSIARICRSKWHTYTDAAAVTLASAWRRTYNSDRGRTAYEYARAAARSVAHK
jgi:hypothetical protein